MMGVVSDSTTPLPLFRVSAESKGDEVACFDTHLQVFILKMVRGESCGQNAAKRGVCPQVLITRGLGAAGGWARVFWGKGE